MALHSKSSRSKTRVEHTSDANPFMGTANPLFCDEVSPPKHRLADGPVPADVAYQLVHDELLLDGSARLNLATFVTTWMEPQADKLMAECVDKNMIDKDEYPRTAELEQRCVNDAQPNLWHSRSMHEEATGTSTTGSSEACDARRDGTQVALAGAPVRRRRSLTREAQPRDGHQRPGVLGEVLPLLGCRAPRRADGGRSLPP